MSIHETIEFDNSGEPVRNPIFRKVFLPLTVLLVGLLGYGLGRLENSYKRPAMEIKYDPSAVESALPKEGNQPSATTATGVYASSKGTKYYYSGCKSTIAAANKITFADSATAEAAGYTLASGCRKP